LEADFARSYGVDLRELVGDHPPFGMRRLRALILGLPPDAMVWRREPGWGTAEELAALNAELTHSVVRVLVSAFSKKGSSPLRPFHVPRPFEARQRTERAKRLEPSDLGRLGIAVGRGVSSDGR
jgi:hypothetical protein